jgi:hypothetical protein
MCIAAKHTDGLSSTLRNQVTSPLLHLPAELRNRIYAYALAIDNPIRIAVNFSGGPPRLQATVENDYLWQYKTFDRTFSIRRWVGGSCLAGSFGLLAQASAASGEGGRQLCLGWGR